MYISTKLSYFYLLFVIIYFLFNLLSLQVEQMKNNLKFNLKTYIFYKIT